MYITRVVKDFRLLTDSHWIWHCPMDLVFASQRYVTQVYRSISCFIYNSGPHSWGSSPRRVWGYFQVLQMLPLLLKIDLSHLYFCLCLGTEDLAVNICLHCCIAPFTIRLITTSSEPWLEKTTRTLRHDCRQAETKWKKDTFFLWRKKKKSTLRPSLPQAETALLYLLPAELSLRNLSLSDT